MSRPASRAAMEREDECVCQHCDLPCWLTEDPCAEAEMRRRMEQEATVERDSLEAFFLRLLLLDNIKQEAKEGPGCERAAESKPEAAPSHFRPRQPRPVTPVEEEPPAEEECCRCRLTVYRAELRQTRGQSYHAACYSCIACHRMLDAMRVTDGPDGEAYCTTCYRTRFAAESRPLGAASTTSILAKAGARDRCPRCSGRVFQAEQVLSAGGAWHRGCFRCAMEGCGRSLEPGSYCDSPQGLVYCRSCYSRLPGSRAPAPGTTPGPGAANRTREPGARGSNRCPRCDLAVYAQERCLVGERQWHRACLACSTCRAALHPGSLNAADSGATVVCRRCLERGAPGGQ